MKALLASVLIALSFSIFADSKLEDSKHLSNCGGTIELRSYVNAGEMKYALQVINLKNCSNVLLANGSHYKAAQNQSHNFTLPNDAAEMAAYGGLQVTISSNTGRTSDTVVVRASARSKIFCDEYVTNNGTRGYSIVRSYDRVDIGNAVFTSIHSCQSAVQNSRHGIVCAPYYNSRNGVTYTSIYRISDGKDLGNLPFTLVSECFDAVSSSKRDLFCAPYYSSNGQSGYSLYQTSTGHDVGTQMYTTLQSCLSNL